MQLTIAVAYGGRWDIVQAARKLGREIAVGALDPSAIDEARFAGALETADLPPVDLLIRTGGEQRISNFLIWDTAYSELYFCDALWPAFDAAELERAFAFYEQRQRRFGRTGEQVEAATC
jgi:undecaprenyl diphosphate synthase